MTKFFITLGILLSVGCTRKVTSANVNEKASHVPNPITFATPTPSPFATPTPWTSSFEREITLPSPTSPLAFCRPAESNYNLAYCLNSLIREKDAYPNQNWRISIAPGSHSLKDNVMVFGVQNLEIVGISDTGGRAPQLHSDGLPTSRLQYQYYTFLIANAVNVTVRNLELFGENLGAQRGIAVCSLPGFVMDRITLRNLTFTDYQSYATIVGNGILEASLNDIAGYMSPGNPTQKFIDYLHNLTVPRVCSGEVRNLLFTENLVKAKNVGFYLVPPTAKATENIVVDPPVAYGPNQVPGWYFAKDAFAARYSGIEVSHNRFENATTGATEAQDNKFHSVLKLHGALGVRVIDNQVDLSTLPRNDTHVLIGINLAAGLVGAIVQDNVITLPPNMLYPYAINIQSYFQGHDDYGFGDKKIFGPTIGTQINHNNVVNGVIRFSDCCVQEDAGSPDYRPYCRELDGLVGPRIMRENISLNNNAQNGQTMRDANLIWRISQKESSTAWFQGYVTRGQQGNGGIYCRQYMDVMVYSADGSPR